MEATLLRLLPRFRFAYIKSFLKNALMIEGSCDDHRTKISSDAQVSFARGVWMHLGWEETEPPLNEMALDQTWSLPEGTSRRSHEYETRPWTFLPVKPPSSLWCDSETTMMCGPMNLGIGLPDSKRHEPRHLFPAWSAAGSQFWTRLYRPGRPSGYDPSSRSNLLVACWTPSPLWPRLHGCAFMAAPSWLRLHGCAFMAAPSWLRLHGCTFSLLGHSWVPVLDPALP